MQICYNTCLHDLVGSNNSTIYIYRLLSIDDISWMACDVQQGERR